VYVLITAPYVT